MPIESIKLSQKKNGKGYASSYSVSISNKEAHGCMFAGRELIKIVDGDKQEIIIKAKKFTITTEILRRVAELKELEKKESMNIDSRYFADRKMHAMSEALHLFVDEQAGKVERPAERQLRQYLLSLTLENIADLALLMYLGRDMDCNMNVQPGEERFLDFYSRYSGLVCGKSKEDLVDIILEKTPLLLFLRTGYRLLTSPVGSTIESFIPNWDEM